MTKHGSSARPANLIWGAVLGEWKAHHRRLAFA